MSGVYEGIPREQIPWYPTVNTDDCEGCQECIEHCPGDVFDWDEANAYPLVARPYNCVVYCVGCAKVCPEDAISFPPKGQIVALVKELREKYASAQTICPRQACPRPVKEPLGGGCRLHGGEPRTSRS